MIDAAMQASLLNEPCGDLHPGLSSAIPPKPAEDQWTDKKQELEIKQEPGTQDTQNTNTDVNPSKLQCHSSNVKPTKKVHECSVCHKQFSASYRLKRHSLIHTDERPFPCPACSHGFRDSSHLKIHFQRMHSTSFKKRTLFPQRKRYKSVTSGQAAKSSLKRPVCNRIGKTHSVSKHVTLQRDVNSGDEQKSPTVDVLKTFPIVEIRNFLKSDLKMIKGHWCPICLKCFPAPSKLERHSLIHSKKKPFKCIVCSKAFQEKSGLQLHKCERGFELKSVLKHVEKGLNGNQKAPLRLTRSTAARSEDTDTLKEASTSSQVEAENQCSICLKIFEYPSRLSRHLLSHSDARPYKCRVCSKTFRHLCHLRFHQIIHKKTVKKKVPPVSKPSNLVSEQQLQDKSGNQCEICLKVFITPSKLKRHLPVHLNVKACTICGKTFKQSYHLYKHMKLHAGEENVFSKLYDALKQNGAQSSKPRTNDGNVSLPQVFDKINNTNTDNSSPTNLKESKGVNQCIICRRIFPYPSKLYKHLLSHADVKPFKCHLCSLSFQHRCHLCWHQMIHKIRIPPVTGSSYLMYTRQLKKKSEYHCKICLKSFTKALNLSEHLQLHTRERNVSVKKLCEVPQEFGDQSSTPEILEGTKNCGLDDCNVSLHQTFDSDNTQRDGLLECISMLDEHVLYTEIAATVEIESSDIEETRNPEVQTSSPTNPTKSRGVNQCSFCLKTFQCPSKLSRHLLSHTSVKPFKCNVCSKSFQHRCDLRWHQMIHKSTRPLKKKCRYWCELCLKSFSQACYVKKHLTLHTRKRNNPLTFSEVLQGNGARSSPRTLKGTNNCRLDDGSVSVGSQKASKSMLNQHEMLPIILKIEGNYVNGNKKTVVQTSRPTNHIKSRGVIQSRHLLSHTENKPFKCNVCSKSFQHRCQLRWHQRIHKKMKSYDIMHIDELQKKLYRCDICLMSFRKALYLENHLKSHAEERNSPELCDIPQENETQSSTSGTLDGTSKRGLDGGNLSQVVGSVGIQTNKKLECNSMINENVPSAESESDNMETESIDDLSNEEAPISPYTSTNLENSESVNQCSICQKVFQYPSRLARHLLIHTDIKPFKCKVCSKSFRRLCHLQSHQLTHIKPGKKAALKTHTGERNSSSKSCEVLQQNKAQSSTSGTLDGTSDSGLDGSNVSMDTQTDEMVESNNLSNQNVPLKEMVSITVKIEGNGTGVEENKDTENPNPTSLTSKSVNQCSICMKTFQNRSNLSKHRLIHSDIKPFKCNVCSKSFRIRGHLNRHQKIHKKQLRKGGGYHCEKCLKTFVASSQLKNHLCVPLEDETYVCTICGKSFREAFHLDEHMMSHTAERKQQNKAESSTSGTFDGTNDCEMDVGSVSSHRLSDSVNTQTNKMVESNSFYNQNDPSTDMASITVEIEGNDIDADERKDTDTTIGIGVHQCNICLKSFPYPSGLSRHVLTHSDVKPFECNVCSKSFSDLSNLRTHQMIHKRPPESTSDLMGTYQLEKDIRNQCEICWKVFSSPHTLRKHRRVHLDVKSFICTVCGDSFRQSSNLVTHMKFHTGERNSSAILREELRQDGGQSSTPGTLDGMNDCGLDECNESLPQILESLDTQTNNMLESNYCFNQDMSSMTFENEGNDIDTAVRDYKKSENQCSICMKSFQYPSGLVRHILTHTDFKPFKCYLCSKAFRRLWDLRQHLIVHKKRGEDIVAGHKEGDQMDSFGNPVIPKDEDVPVPLQDGADDPSMFTNNMLSQKMSGDSSDSGVFFSAGTSLSQNVQANPSSEVAFQYSNKSVYGLMHNSLVEKTPSDIVPFGGVSDCPPKTDSSPPLYCASNSRAKEDWAGHMDEIEEDFDSVKHDHDSYMSRSCSYPQKLNDPDLKQELVVGRLGLQDTGGHFTQPPRDILVCPDCSQCFSNEMELYTHKCAYKQPEETMRKSYQCDVCFKTFDLPSKLKRHSVSHLGLRPFQCTVCQKTYTRADILRTHMLRAHPQTQVEGFPQGLPKCDQSNEISQ